MQPLRIGPDGWIDGARRIRSPNCDARPAGAAVELLVLHNISLPPGRFGSGCVEQLFRNEAATADHSFMALLAGLRVSAHFLIERDGRLTQFVGVDQRAWHAGASCFEGRSGCNDFSVGAELEGTDFTEFEPAQYAMLARLVKALRAVLPLRAVRGHSHIAAGRKTDPGPLFDWDRFARQADLPAGWLP
ncbi:MAG: 1,6-anhydro-N-acetylmuramyl-L-alanine amidase AmpD [Burkholderiaceae bacterium]|nr:1,6-anhydro-N-acetylmuramyl-L-alanine amidase AmpD [Burkholderiaceae bacterium]